MVSEIKRVFDERNTNIKMGENEPVPIVVSHAMPFPPKLDLKGNLAINWRRIKRVWSNNEIASGLNKKDGEIRSATFLTCVGYDEGLKVLSCPRMTVQMSRQ